MRIGQKELIVASSPRYLITRAFCFCVYKGPHPPDVDISDVKQKNADWYWIVADPGIYDH
jgi:hypothetical protein